MARPLRIEFPGALYHLTTRSNVALQDLTLNLFKVILSSHNKVSKRAANRRLA